ncbi:uncharacterized protein B0I36DRAFT_312002 [Microdochium trichocladiopsis]|uniref:Uncharacterized protein n=1 Tax=Microdochium trichocladiopsis TaxID=1682393 RepID=A0A9P9BWY2_9PEZI|nr:uncharacterized protein B0I36DRAFT_312002 [Microdochium trichocladiopsis]KAH7041040.1 hypothetical protein B0I36DRAFT_312002 [Microdochium trichocladiopsis]
MMVLSRQLSITCTCMHLPGLFWAVTGYLHRTYARVGRQPTSWAWGVDLQDGSGPSRLGFVRESACLLFGWAAWSVPWLACSSRGNLAGVVYAVGHMFVRISRELPGCHCHIHKLPPGVDQVLLPCFSTLNAWAFRLTAREGSGMSKSHVMAGVHSQLSPQSTIHGT